ncbi:MAG: oligosaccharide flippase family protein [Acidobacteria bacterium]|nr:oligosaccharide flippase family protein [Acidobacteriota bacterium]
MNMMAKWLDGARFPDLVNSLLSAQLTRAAAWVVLSTGTLQLFNLFAAIVTARLLGKTHFGELAMLQSTLGMFGVFAGLGLGITTVKFVAEFKRTDPDRSGRIIGLLLLSGVLFGVVCALFLVACAPNMAARVLSASALASDLRLGAGLVVFNTLNGVQLGAFTGLEAYRSAAYVNLVRGLVCMPVLIVPVAVWQLPGAVCGLVAAAGLGCLLNQLALHRVCRAANITIRYSGLRSDLRVLWSFSVPAFLGMAMTSPVTWIGNTMLVQLPGGYAEMGLFNAANHWRSALATLPGLVAQPVLPVLSHLHAVGDLRQHRRVLLSTLKLISLLVAGLALPVFLLAPVIMSAYGPDYRRGASVLVVLALTAVLSACCSVIGQSIASAGRMWHGLLLNCIWACAFLLAAQFSVARWGALGLAVALLSSYLVHAITTAVYSAFVFMNRETGRTTQHQDDHANVSA